MRFSAARCLAITLAAVSFCVQTAGPLSAQEADALQPVFVRFSEQLFTQGADYKRFCIDHADVDRSENRRMVIRRLKENADQSWDSAAQQIEKLIDDDQIADVARYWIVNGFACRANQNAIHQFEQDESVAFVYRLPVPFVVPLHTRPTGRQPGDPQRQIVEQVLEDWIDDTQEPVSLADIEIPWNVERIHAPEAWTEEQATGAGVTVALCDSGLMVTPSLMRALWRNPDEQFDGEDNDGNGYVDDVFGYDFGFQHWYCIGDGLRNTHGSACGGIIAGRPLNSANLATGIAPRAKLMMLRGMGFLKAYEYAAEKNADVMSMSYMWIQKPLGDYRGLYRLAHEHLAAAGIVAVGGAGNFRTSKPAGEQIALPKDIPCVIAAAGILQNGEQAPFSSEGPCYWDGVPFYDDFPEDAPLQKPDVTGIAGGYPVWWRPAPARRQQRWELISDEGQQIGLVIGPQGNSFSGPHAAGVAALVLSVNPELNAWEVKQILEETCDDLGEDGWDPKYGHGLLNAAAAVRRARETP